MKILIKHNLTTVDGRQSLKTSSQGLKTKLRDKISEVALHTKKRDHST